MEVTRKTRVLDLISNEDMRNVLAWYGLPVEDRHFFRASLEDYCMAHDVDVEDVLVELAVSDIESEDGWDDDDIDGWLETA